MKREVLLPGNSPTKVSRRVCATGKVMLGQTRDDMHKPTMLARPQPSKYLIRRETAGKDLSAPALRPKTASTQMMQTGESMLSGITEDQRPSTADARGGTAGGMSGFELATPPLHLNQDAYRPNSSDDGVRYRSILEESLMAQR